MTYSNSSPDSYISFILQANKQIDRPWIPFLLADFANAPYVPVPPEPEQDRQSQPETYKTYVNCEFFTWFCMKLDFTYTTTIANGKWQTTDDNLQTAVTQYRDTAYYEYGCTSQLSLWCNSCNGGTAALVQSKVSTPAPAGCLSKPLSVRDSISYH